MNILNFHYRQQEILIFNFFFFFCKKFDQIWLGLTNNSAVGAQAIKYWLQLSAINWRGLAKRLLNQFQMDLTMVIGVHSLSSSALTRRFATPSQFLVWQSLPIFDRLCTNRSNETQMLVKFLVKFLAKNWHPQNFAGNPMRLVNFQYLHFMVNHNDKFHAKFRFFRFLAT